MTDIPSETGEAKEPTPETPSARDKRGRFQKGAPSANPRGRPTESHELKVLAREKSPEAIKRLLFWLRSDDSTASIAAAKELLNRGYGRSELGVTIDATVTTPRVYPSMSSMDANEAADAYFDLIRSPAGSVTFEEDREKTPEEFYAEFMRVGRSSEDERRRAARALAGRTFRELVEAGRKAEAQESALDSPARPVLSPPPTPISRAEPTEAVLEPISAETRPAPQDPAPADPAPASMGAKTRELWERLGKPANPEEALSALDAALRQVRAPWVVT